ncbi:tRNA epoxyqueuosine(34) reductase QueG [bacterium]|nr:tRNA epoxyqueuosine(34) reductase QueG [bacterium]
MIEDRQQLRETIRDEALGLGFSRVGFTDAEPLSQAQRRRWERWFEEDKAGVMTWLARRQPRRTHPRDLLPGAQTAIVVAATYYDGDHPDPPAGRGIAGKIARYAWGRDYHYVVREQLEKLAQNISDSNPDEKIEFLICVDSKPVDERALAARAGMGFIGKNTMLIDPDGGSWTLLGVMLTSLELPPDEPLRAPTASCGSCRRCIDACPTGAITAPYALDPRRCISYLTIEQHDEIPGELAEKMNGWAFGCDICQEACPFNVKPLKRMLSDLAATEGTGPWMSEAALNETPSGKSFLRRWRESPITRAGLKGMRKNLRLSEKI